jgi:DMSO/TMAO reductase YedYZ molybdopterin-dependent catalytic subunit
MTIPIAEMQFRAEDTLMVSRRALLAGSVSLVATPAGAQKPPLSRGLPSGLAEAATLEALPGKKPLIKLSYRPPNYETPVSYFTDAITPNDSFFVRYHLADIPEIDAAKWTLTVSGGQNPLSLKFEDLKLMPAVEVTAVCQCSGNRRGLSDPHVAGVEWGYGAMGCAKWKGVRLKDVLTKAGAPANAVEIIVDGADKPVLDKTPDFVKSLPLWKAMDDNTILAYEMNGLPLPHFNGAPVRLIVPGWTATYWMKHIVDIRFTDKPFDGFWMKSAYRVPIGMFPSIDRFISQETPANTPITEIVVNSLITAPSDGGHVQSGAMMIAGIVWDSGRGIDQVDVSVDGGKSWVPATLGPDVGRFAFRTWSLETQAKAGPLTILSRASNNAGQSQVPKALFNAAGYHQNVFNSVTVMVG